MGKLPVLILISLVFLQHTYGQQVVQPKARRIGLNMQKMVVFYDGGGQPENIEVRSNIPEGGESRIIDLRGGSRMLKSVQFWYDTKGWLKGMAKLTLFGIK